eukprot:m.234607 g.234607  ORF g.234607 m.234607 type:complete len:308 (-) comp19688_c0_seq1:24-947(-)
MAAKMLGMRLLSTYRRLPADEWGKLVKSVTNPTVSEAVHHITRGPGFVLFENVFSKADIDEANQIVSDFAAKELKRELAKEEYTFGKDTGHSNIYNAQAMQGVRMWNLLEKGQVFERLIQPEIKLQIIDQILGDDFCLGSFAANYLQPGAAAQKAHLDYPYWDYVNGQGKGKGSWPSAPKFNADHVFLMNIQSLIMMDDFTLDNGATAVVPFSQREVCWPNEKLFDEQCNYVTGKKGTLLIFTGLMHHGSTANRSAAKRCSLLGQYLPKYVRPMEDMNQVGAAVRARATPRMKQLLGEHTPYPKVFE